MESRLEDRAFRRSFDKSLKTLGSKLDYDEILRLLRDEDPGINLLLEQPRYSVRNGNNTLDLSPTGKFEQCISNLLIDSALVESFRHNNPIEALDSEKVRQFLMRTSQLGPFISRDLVSLANKEYALKGEEAKADEISNRAYEIGTKLLRFFNGLDTEDYKAVLASEIKEYVRS